MVVDATRKFVGESKVVVVPSGGAVSPSSQLRQVDAGDADAANGKSDAATSADLAVDANTQLVGESSVALVHSLGAVSPGSQFHDVGAGDAPTDAQVRPVSIVL
ncbi:unnamed protein product [Calypogeia fissa]